MTDAASNPADIAALSFEEALAQLERIVAELEWAKPRWSARSTSTSAARP